MGHVAHVGKLLGIPIHRWSRILKRILENRLWRYWIEVGQDTGGIL
jgi:hypothetical protein